MLNSRQNAVVDFDKGEDLSELIDCVCNKFKMPMLKANPLFGKTIDCLRENV